MAKGRELGTEGKVNRRGRQVERLSARTPQEPADRAVENLMRQMEGEFRTICDQATAAVFLLDAEAWKFTMCNQSCLRMLGYTLEEFVKLGVADLHPAEDLPFIYAQIEVFLRGGKPVRHDIRFRRKDGSVLFADVSPDLVVLDGKRYLVVTLKDITERKRIEEELRQQAEHLQELVDARTRALQESEARYRSLAENDPDIIQRFDRDLRRLYANPAFEEATGISPQVAIGKRDRELELPQDLIPFWEEAAQAVFRTGESRIITFEMPTPHGSRHYEAHLVPEFAADGSVEHLLAITRDITGRRRAEEALRFTQFAIDHTADAAFWMTEEGRFFYVNEAACRALGYSREELLEMTVYDIDPAFTESKWRETWRKLKAEKSILLETVHRARDGRVYPVEIRANYLEFGGRAYDCAFARDITERKRAEEALRDKEYLLSESQRIGHIGAWSVDLIAHTAAWTPETYRLFGVSPDTFVPSAETLLALLHPDDRDALREWMRAALAGEHPEAVEFRVPLPDGSVRVLIGQGESVFADGHQPVRLVGTVQDVTEQKQAQAALLESEERYRILMEHGFDGIFVHEDFRILQLNDRLAEMVGCTRAELLGAPVMDLFTPEARERIWRYVDSGEVGYFEIELRRRDGRIVTVESFGAPCEFQGRHARIVGLRDITERKRAEEALRFTQFAIDHTADAAFWMTEDARFFYVNEAACQALGYSRDELLQMTVYDIDPAFTKSMWRESWRRLKTEKSRVFETVHRARDGRTYPVEIRVNYLEFGGCEYHCAFARDITERKRADEALRESEERFRTAFEEGAVAMALTALDTTLLKVNSSFCRMLGFPEAELVGRSFTDITHPDDRAANLAGSWQLACGTISSFRMEKRYIRKDGGVVWADMNTASVRDAQGRPQYCVTHIQDITERKQAEEALHRLNEQLELQVAQRTEDLRRTVGRLQQMTLELSQAEDRERKRIADILHEDVQQTLAAAKFHLNLLSRETRSAEESRRIVEQVKQMLREAIEKSRSLSHELSPALYQVDLTETLEWLAQHMQQKHGLAVHVRTYGQPDSPSEPLKAFLYKVAQELLFNVAKHAGVREAWIRVRRRGSYLYLRVADRGRGFEPEKLEGVAGFGLLSIRERVQLLGGRMKIHSAPGRGSRFLIAIPDQAIAPDAVPAQPDNGPPPTDAEYD